MTTTDLELMREATVIRVLELLISGEAKTVIKACELAGVSTSAYYKWRKAGVFDEVLAQMKAANIAEVVSAFTSALPELYDKTLKDALDNDVSVRDRDLRTRTAMIIYKDIAGMVVEPATGESAADFLTREGHRFQPVQINVAGDLVVAGEQDSPEVVEGEAEELE